MNREENDLFQLCQALVSYGKLNEDSIRQLSDYINNTPKASESWPGNILIEPLQKVWKDGVIDEAELDSLTKLLACIVQPETPKQKIPQAQSLKDSSVKTNKRRRREVGNLRKRQWGLGLVAIVAVLIMRAAGCDTSRRRRRRRR